MHIKLSKDQGKIGDFMKKTTVKRSKEKSLKWDLWIGYVAVAIAGVLGLVLVYQARGPHVNSTELPSLGRVSATGELDNISKMNEHLSQLEINRALAYAKNSLHISEKSPKINQDRLSILETSPLPKYTL